MNKEQIKKELILKGSKIIMDLACDVSLNPEKFTKKEMEERLDLIFHTALTFENILNSKNKDSLEKFYDSQILNNKEVK